ncbi:response regulator [Massilia mucilaginosa]|uniref:response regulator n=1 Tax=Massilia mucilaginosa TaxID=2609282 RepID=UPI001E4CA281|nr:response regulator [Massilia mucilaginosa]
MRRLRAVRPLGGSAAVDHLPAPPPCPLVSVTTASPPVPVQSHLLWHRRLAGEGFRNVVSTTDPRHTLDLVSAFDPDLVLLDLMMPDLDGYAVLEQLARRTPPTSFVRSWCSAPT